MSAGASLAYPGSRTLGAWWRQLASHQPEEMWVGYVTFHHVAAPFVLIRPRKLPTLESFVLKAMTFCRPPGNLPGLGDWLHLDAGLILRVVEHLQHEGLAARNDRDSAEITEAGKAASVHGEYPRALCERQTLEFWHAHWTSPPSSRFVRLSHPEALTWLAAPQTPFAALQLSDCVAQSADWKKRHGFPEEIKELLAKPPGQAVEAWEQMVVATPQRVFAVVLRTQAAGQSRLVGFAANSRNWELHAAQAAFDVPDEPPGWFPPPLSEQAVRQAFAEWCQQRQIPAAEMEQCALKFAGSRLTVTAPPSWQERLLAGRGEFWVLAGDPAVRTALRLEFA